MSNEIAVMDMDDTKLDLIKRTVAKGATNDELSLFLHACKRTGLDPLMKQIHAIKRWSAADNREVMSIQTGIDGYRLIAERTGAYAGSDEPVFEEREGLPVKATVTVWKLMDGQRYAFTASARFSEYAQRKKDGQLTTFWMKMPFGQLAKCAEALALRKAFPAELSGVYTHEEMQQADNDQAAPVVHVPHVRPHVGNRDLSPPMTDPYPKDRQEDGVAPALGDSQPTLQSPVRPDAPALRILKFGKYAGTCIEDVPRDYLEWARDSGPDSLKKIATEELTRRAYQTTPPEDTGNRFVEVAYARLTACMTKDKLDEVVDLIWSEAEQEKLTTTQMDEIKAFYEQKRKKLTK